MFFARRTAALRLRTEYVKKYYITGSLEAPSCYCRYGGEASAPRAAVPGSPDDYTGLDVCRFISDKIKIT